MRQNHDFSAKSSADVLALALIQGELIAPWEHSASLAFAFTAQGLINAVNLSFARKFGRPSPDWIGTPVSDLIHLEDAHLWNECCSRLEQSHQCEEHESRWHTAQGWRWLSWELCVLYDESGLPSGFRAIGRDTTRQRVAAEHAFMLGSAVEQSPVGILITDLNGGARYVNESFTQATGYSLEELLDRPVSILREAVSGEQEFTQFLAHLRAGQDWTGELKFKKRDGSVLWEELHVTPIKGEGGRVSHLLCLWENITEHRRLEEQLRQAQKMESLGTLAGGIAHDFNNMLAIINGYAEVCLNKPAIQSDEGLRRYLREIHGAAQRAVGLVQRILTFSRKTEVKVTSLNLNKLLRELGGLLSETFPRTISLEYELCESLPALSADPNQIQQVIMNLCVNARDAMAKGGRITLHSSTVPGSSLAALGADHATNYICLKVTDTGCGMPESVRQHIFEPFFTTKHDSGGTGLGLAVVYGIILSHKGLLDVSSTPGTGTSFCAYFPVLEQVCEAPKPSPQPHFGDFPSGQENVLIVEDELSLRTLLLNVLDPCGYNVITACDGRDALRRIRDLSIQIDAIILDLNMPEVHGVEVYAEIRRLRPQVKTLVVSGNITPKMKEDLGAMGQKDFLLKPYRLDEICRKLREILDAR